MLKVKKEGSKKLESNDYEPGPVTTIKFLFSRPELIWVLLHFYSLVLDCFGLPQQTKYFLILICKPCNDEEPAAWDSILSHMERSSFRGCHQYFKK